MLPSKLILAGRHHSVFVAMILAGCGGCAQVQPDNSPDPMTTPKHLRNVPEEMWLRVGDKVVKAPPEDLAVARSYPRARNKGPLSPSGERLTILTAKVEYSSDEEIRVIHIHEATLPGIEVYVAGPKTVHGETINGRHVTPRKPGGFGWDIYDGPVEPSPAVDYNYVVTVYRLPRGTHVIRWAAQTVGQEHAPDGPPKEKLVSNERTIVVE